MLGRRVTAENAPTHNMNQSGTDLKREGERRHKEKLIPLPFSPIWTKDYPENAAKIYVDNLKKISKNSKHVWVRCELDS